MGLRWVFALLVLLAASLAASAQTHTDLQDKGSLRTLAASKENTAPSSLEPWIDLRRYGARPLNSANNPNTTGSTLGTSVVVASNSGWQISDGLVISKAGNPTRQSTPAAPTVTPLGLVGSSRISYKCVGEDFNEGLTAASPAGSTTTGPAVFGQVPNTITAIARASGTVSATVSGTLPYSSGNYHMILMNVTWPSGVYDGLEYVTITSSNTFTYSQIGSDESGTVGAYSAARLVNGFVITSITRTGSTITVTTDVNHDFAVGTAYYPTVLVIEGVTPTDLDGYYTLASKTANTLVFKTNLSYGSQTETGSLLYGSTTNGKQNWNQMGVYGWESSLVTCPAVTLPTNRYYIYADYVNGGSGPFNLIGSTIPGGNTFRDWGPFTEGTYTAPPAAAVPSTAPSSAQNQEYVGTITSIAGTTFTVTPTIPTSVSGQNVYHDASLAIQAASNAACNTGGSIVYFSGPSNPSVTLNEPQGYVVNAPFNTTTNTSCRNLQWMGGAPITFNDTMTDNMYGDFTIQGFSSGAGGGSASQDNYWSMYGVGNPLINALWINGTYPGGDAIFMNHVNASAGGGGNNVGISAWGNYSRFENMYFTSNGAMTAVSVGGGFDYYMRNVVFAGYPYYISNYAFPLSLNEPDGQPTFAPLIPNIDVNTTSLFMEGYNSGSGKGIQFDTYNDAVISFKSTIKNVYTLQNVQTPGVWVYGQAGISGLEIDNFINDSVSGPIYANFGGAIQNVTIGLAVTGGLIVEGNPGPGGFTFRDEYYQNNSLIGANMNMTRLNAPQAVYAGPYGTISRSETQQKRPFMFPFNVNYPLFWEQQTSGVTATVNGSGTIAAGSHTFCVLPVGWNGGDGGYGLSSCATVTVNGSQGVKVNATPTPGVQGYDIYADGFRTNGSIVTSLPVTYSSITNYGSGPGNPGSGLPLIDQNQLATPLLRLTNANYKLDVTAGTLSGNASLQANAIPLGYSHSGSLLTGFHIVEDTGTLSRGTLTVTLVGSAVYTRATSYNCKAQDTTTPANGIISTYSSGSRIVFTGTGTDAFNYTCWGN